MSCSSWLADDEQSQSCIVYLIQWCCRRGAKEKCIFLNRLARVLGTNYCHLDSCLGHLSYTYQWIPHCCHLSLSGTCTWTGHVLFLDLYLEYKNFWFCSVKAQWFFFWGGKGCLFLRQTLTRQGWPLTYDVLASTPTHPPLVMLFWFFFLSF